MAGRLRSWTIDPGTIEPPNPGSMVPWFNAPGQRRRTTRSRHFANRYFTSAAPIRIPSFTEPSFVTPSRFV